MAAFLAPLKATDSSGSAQPAIRTDHRLHDTPPAPRKRALFELETCTSKLEVKPSKRVCDAMPDKGTYADDLLRLGVAVVPIFPTLGTLEEERVRLLAAMDSFPEYAAKGFVVQRVLGGFGALGNPSSFHHASIRRLRCGVKKRLAKKLFVDYCRLRFGATACEQHDVRLESMFDRVCVRAAAFGEVTPEAFHRDVYSESAHVNKKDQARGTLRPLPRSLPQSLPLPHSSAPADGPTPDLICGGWLNLDREPQYLAGILGSHEPSVLGPPLPSPTGFAMELDQAGCRQRLEAQAERIFSPHIRTDARGYVIVPSGHAVVFVQGLVHTVARSRHKGVVHPGLSVRLFHGFRLTTETMPLFDIKGIIETGAVPRIPSGQVPCMYSSNHYAFFSKHERYRQWGEKTFVPEALFQRSTPSGVKYYTPGSAYNTNPAANRGRYMPSLKEMGMLSTQEQKDAFAYSAEDERTMLPERLFFS